MELINYPWWIIVLSAIGGIVALVLGVFIAYLIYHVLRGLIITASYMRWSIRVMKLNGRKPAWNRFAHTLFKRWWYYIGYTNNGSEIVRTGRSWWKGIGDYLIFDESKGQFVQPPVSLREPRFEGDDIDEDIDDEDEDDPELAKLMAGGKRVTSIKDVDHHVKTPKRK